MYSDPKLEEKIVQHEGIRKFVYTDTMGFSTVGIGRNISETGEGLSVDECFYLLRNDIDRCAKELSNLQWFSKQDDVRKSVLIELAFNIGTKGVLAFKSMISALDAGLYAVAAKELLNSKWATQVGRSRSQDMASRLSSGRYL